MTTFLIVCGIVFLAILFAAALAVLFSGDLW